MKTRTGATINLTPALGFKATDFTEATVWDAPSLVLFRTIRWSSHFITMQQGVMRLTVFTFLRTSANVSRMLRSETVETQLFFHKYPTLLHRFTFKALAFPQRMISRAIWTKGRLCRKHCCIACTEKTLELLEVFCCFSFLFGSASAKTWPRNELVRIADSFTNFTSWLNFAKCSSASRSTRSTTFRCRGTGRRFSKSEMSLTRKWSSTLP